MEILTINEIFDPNIIQYLRDLLDDKSKTDNNKKADMLTELFIRYGYYEIGCGTNRIVFSREEFPDLVFKIALDDRGRKDNVSERYLSDFLGKYVTITYETNGYIAVAERCNQIVRKDDFLQYKPDMEFILNDLIVNGYVINDVGPTSFMNYGTSLVDGRLLILDYAYIVPIDEEVASKMYCKNTVGDGIGEYICGGALGYSLDYKNFICVDCGKTFNIGEVVPTMDIDYTEPVSDMIEFSEDI